MLLERRLWLSVMIYDRTQKDIDEARRILEEKVHAFLPLTDEEKEQLERGIVTKETFNRIRNAQFELFGTITSMGYYPGFKIQSAIYNDPYSVISRKDVQQMLDNEKGLYNAFLIGVDTPTVPEMKTYYSYRDFNDIEKILFDMEAMAEDIKVNYRECGNFECGE